MEAFSYITLRNDKSKSDATLTAKTQDYQRLLVMFRAGVSPAVRMERDVL